jgi:predicted Na+-dependent transporter
MEASGQSSNSLLKAAKEFWPYYVSAWVFPLAFLLFCASGYVTQTTFTFLVLPIFFLAFGRASLPWLRKRVGYWPSVFWAVLVPFLIWCIAVFGVGLTAKLLAEA